MKLNQIIAIEKGVKAQAYSLLSEFNKLVQKPDLFNGFIKTYQKSNEESEDLPPDQKKVQQTVAVLLTTLQDALIDFWMVTARKEWANAHATADIIVDGAALAQRVPVTYLLFLEKQLTDLRTFIANLPALDTTEDWHSDVNSDLVKTLPVQTHRTKKIQRPLVLYPATVEHPAQTQLVTEDILAGYWSTTRHSGAISAPDKAVLSFRIERLLRAVKEAREAANIIEEPPVASVAEQILGYLFLGYLFRQR